MIQRFVSQRLSSLLTASLLVLAAMAGTTGCAGTAGKVPSAEEATLTRVGQAAPAIVAVTLDGETFTLADQRGKVVLLNFWATWCPPCQVELPHVRDEIWARHGGRDDFVIVSVAREETPEVVQRFLAAHDFGWTFAVDPERENFARYAAAHIPRNYVIGRDGTIVHQSVGFETEDFAALVDVIDAQLARP
jgi:peroxiredoxin